MCLERCRQGLSLKKRRECNSDGLAENHGMWKNKCAKSMGNFNKTMPRSFRFRWNLCLRAPSAMKLEDCTNINATSMTVMTANGPVDTNEKARVNVEGWDLFATAENTFLCLPRRSANSGWMCLPVETRPHESAWFHFKRTKTGTRLFTEKHVARSVNTVE